MFDIVGIETPVQDLNVNVRSFPKPNLGEAVQQLSWQGGGKVASGMVAAARLGAKCAMMGAVGDDIFGRFCIADFQHHGIDTGAMRIDRDADTTLCIVLSDYETMGRSIVYHHGGVAPLSTQDIHEDLLKNTKYFFISMINEPICRAVDIAKSAGAKILIDADGYSKDAMELLPKLDVFIGSEFFYNACFSGGTKESNCQSLQQKGPKIVVFTFGEKGCAGVGPEGYFEWPAFPVEVADTVGAGDVFHGAFAAALLEGQTASEAARFASAVSAIKCTRIGGRAGIPSRRVVQQFLDEGTIDYTEIDQRVKRYQRGLDYV